MFLGLDIGTTAIKTIIVDDDQKIVAEAATEHPTNAPIPPHHAPAIPVPMRLLRPCPSWCQHNGRGGRDDLD
jgi:glycerol kinase